jgi:hypothetical protein
MSNTSDNDRPVPSIETKLQAHIGRQLRQLYDQIVSEPVPDRFKELLDQLEQREAARGAGSDAGGDAVSAAEASPPTLIITDAQPSEVSR